MTVRQWLSYLNREVDSAIARFNAWAADVDRRSRAGEFGKWPWQDEPGGWPWQKRPKPPSDGSG